MKKIYFMLLCIIATAHIFAQKPLAKFSANPTSGKTPLNVTFTDSSTNNPTSWAWDFGDGFTSNLQNPSHKYTLSGLYDIMLVAINSSGSSDTLKKESFINVISDCKNVVIASNEPNCNCTK